MKHITRHYRKIGYWFIRASLFFAFVWLFFIPSFIRADFSEDNIFYVTLNGENVGIVSSEDQAYEYLREARRLLQLDNTELVLAKADIEITGDHVVWQKMDSSDDVINRMKNALVQNEKDTLKRCYTIKINDFYVNVASKEEVLKILNAALDKYDYDDEFEATLILDPDREVNVLTTEVVSSVDNYFDVSGSISEFKSYGIAAYLDEVFMEDTELSSDDMDFDDYDLGVKTLDFGDKVEVVEAYLPENELTDLASAIEEVTKDQETNQIYEVQSGDTLGSIAAKFNLTVDDLVAMNPTIENENSIIRVEDEIIVTVPEPELTVVRTELEYLEEDYQAEVQYVDNDSWYTTKSVVLQEPSDGRHNAIVLNYYENDKEVSQETIKEEVIYEAVAKIVERGTIVPPTYIKPISGGRLSSGFGYRSRPTKGASTYHKGIDWATPVGTAVMASSGGVVSRAGWGSGYGYVIYIDHPDGRQTRYGHLSKILVSVGDHVSQGQKIALSGNTGVSTGAHLHFEILINGVQVNPLNYLY